jgi:hypothetical protein
MSAQRALPSAPAANRRRDPVTLAAGLALACGLIASCRGGPDSHVLQSRTAPTANRVAAVKLTRCDAAWCETLWTGATPESVQLVATLPPALERCTEIVWSRDGGRVGFLINGYQLRLYDAATNAPAGLVDLVPRDADPSTRIARGLTFSDNGAAVTFDDCPRDRSGCRPGILALR